MSHDAYRKAQERAENPRQTEYRLFAKVTGELMAARDRGLNGAPLMDALDYNRRMWSTFGLDCQDPHNGLPKELRASIVSLSLFVGKHTSAVMRGDASIDDLIDINKTIMEGLASQASGPGSSESGGGLPTGGLSG